ncbi:MAG: hypothetical protein FJY67_10055 [Calditrichaeota bacterium]|nr:hypothetical protein [Calditrichota bacterium]
MTEVFFNASHPGIAYGDGELLGPGTPGQIVKLVESDLFQVVSNAADKPVGLLGRLDKPKYATPAATDRYKAQVFLRGGIYETDNVSGQIAFGADLSFDPTTGLLKTASQGETVIARAIAIGGSTVKFQLLL